jgi:aryl-alcohol dehydrogenase-like predicted oxidoreductase
MSGSKVPDDDWRKHSPEFREPNLRLPAVTGAIVGARNATQAEGVMRAGELKLTPQDIAEIEGTAAAHAGR